MLATAYVRPGNATLVAIASWSTEAQDVTLAIDWDALALDAATSALVAPALPSFNRANATVVFAAGEPIAVPALEGWLLLIQ